MDKIEIAMEELGFLQNIIGRQDILMARAKAFCVTLTAALTVAYLKVEPKLIENTEFLVVVFAIALLFWFIESIYGAVELSAEKRVREIERSFRPIKGNENIDLKDYYGPKICHSLVDTFKRRTIIVAALREQTFSLYLAIGVLAVLVFQFS